MIAGVGVRGADAECTETYGMAISHPKPKIVLVNPGELGF